MTLHILTASILGLVPVCAVAHSPVSYNYSPLHDDSATGSAAAVLLLMRNQAEWAEQQHPETLSLLSEEGKWIFLVQINSAADKHEQSPPFLSFARVCIRSPVEVKSYEARDKTPGQRTQHQTLIVCIVHGHECL